MRQYFRYLLLPLLMVLALSACSSTYFYITEEARDGKTYQYGLSKGYFEAGKSLAISNGRLKITPGDSLLLYLEGSSRKTGESRIGIATLDFVQKARFYIMLPSQPELRSYSMQYNAICEVLLSGLYDEGANLFTCQRGEIVLDSIAKGDHWGRFKGVFLNTQNKEIEVEGDFRAGRKD